MAEINQPGGPEVRYNPERTDSREAVVHAARVGFDEFNKQARTLEAKKTDELTPKERQFLRDRNVFKSGIDETIDHKDANGNPAARDSIPTDFENRENPQGPQFRQYEGIPVGRVIGFLHEKIGALEADPASDKMYIAELKQSYDVLRRNTKAYSERRSVSNGKFFSRVEEEARRIAQDPLVATHDQNGNSDLVANYYYALNEIRTRQELIFPKNKNVVLPPEEPDTKLLPPGQRPAELPPGNHPPELPPGQKPGELGPGQHPPELPPGVHPPELPPGQKPPELPPGQKPPELPPGVKPPELPPGDRPLELPPGRPTPEDVDQIRRDFAIVNRHADVEKRAREYAEQKVREEYKKGSFLNPKDMFRKIKLRVGEEYYRQKYIQEARTAMLANNNSYMDMDAATLGLTDAKHRIDEERQAGTAKAEQVALQARERIQVGGTEVKEAHGALKDAIMKDIIRPVIEGKITDPAQVQDVIKQFVEANNTDPDVQEIFGKDATQYGKQAEYYASNLLETGALVREDVAAHRYAMEQIDEVVHIQLGNPSWAAETQANFNTADKLIARLQNGPLRGWAANPAAIGLAASAVGFFGTRLPGRVGQAAGAVPGVGVLMGAGFAALRRNMDLKHDMEAHRVERAYNMQVPKDAKRREALEQFAYKTASVNELLEGGQDREGMLGGDSRGLKELAQLNLSINNPNTPNPAETDLRALMNREHLLRRMSEVQARLDFSAQEKVDLITFETREQVEQGRLELIKGLAQARLALKNAGMDEDTMKADLDRYGSQWTKSFIQDRDQENRKFANYRVKESLKAGAFAGAIGLGGVFVSQEALAGAGRVIGKHVNDTILEHGIKGIGGIAETVKSHLPTPGSVPAAVGAVAEAGRNTQQAIGSIDVTPGAVANKVGEVVNGIRSTDIPGVVSGAAAEAGNKIGSTNPEQILRSMGDFLTAEAPVPSSSEIHGLISADLLKQAYENPRNFPIFDAAGNHIASFAVSPDISEDGGRAVTLLSTALDAEGNKVQLPTPPMWVDQDAKGGYRLIASGGEYNMPQGLKDVIKTFDHQRSPQHDLRALMRQAVDSYYGRGGPDTVIEGPDSMRGMLTTEHGDIRYDISHEGYDKWAKVAAEAGDTLRDGEIGKMSIQDALTGQQIHGFVNKDNIARFPLDHYGNEAIGIDQWKAMAQKLSVDGWIFHDNTGAVVQPQDITPHMELFGTPPEATQYVPKDIVDAPVVTTAFAPRNPLEAMERPDEKKKPDDQEGETPPPVTTPPSGETPTDQTPPTPPVTTPPPVPPGGDSTGTTTEVTVPTNTSTEVVTTGQDKTGEKTQTRVPIEELLTYEQMKEAGYTDEEIQEHAQKKEKTPPTQETTETTIPISEQEPLYRYEAAVATKASTQHPDTNEDTAITDGGKGVIAVFDGSGGNSASILGKESFETALATLPPRATRAEIEAAMQAGWKTSQERIQADEAANPDHKGMASTGTVVKIFMENGKRYAMVLQAGDSRGSFVQKDGTLRQVTKDDAARLGNDSQMPSIDVVEVTDNDAFFITTTKGVHEQFTPEEMAATAKGHKSAQELVRRLVMIKALEARRKNIPIPDDMTAAAIKLEGIDTSKTGKTEEEQQRERRVELGSIVDIIRSLKEKGEATTNPLFFTGANGEYGWEEVRMGSPVKADSDHAFRGYLMVEPNDIPLAMQILLKKAPQLLAQGQGVDAKFLLMKLPQFADVAERNKYINNRDNLAKYEGLTPEDPRIALYGDSQAAIEAILTVLAEDPQWQDIEQRRLDAFGGSDHTPRRPGTNALVHKGREYRSLNYGNIRGYSEDEAADPAWRDKKIGEQTVPLAS